MDRGIRGLDAVFTSHWTVGSLVRFHTAHKLRLMAHDPAAYAELGRLVAVARSVPADALRERYSDAFTRALSTPPTPGRHANVLHHILGYFKHSLARDARAELLSLIDRFAAGQVPLPVPLALFRHHIRRCNVSYLAGQSYLAVCPRDLFPSGSVSVR